MIALGRGFVLSVIAGALAATVALLAFGILESGDLPAMTSGGLRFLGAFMTVAALYSALAMLVICLPLTGILSRIGRERSWSYPLFGLAAGFLTSFLIFMPVPFDPTNISVPLIVAGALSGFTAGIAWWHTYRKKRANDGYLVRAEGGYVGQD